MQRQQSVSHSRGARRRPGTQTQICTVLWNFPPTLYQQREDGGLNQVVLTHTPAVEKSVRQLTRRQPWLNIFLQSGLMRGGDGGRAPAVTGPKREGKGRAEVLQMGTRKCGKSTKRTMWGGVGLGTRICPSCHSTPRTLECAKHCFNAVIWTKNIGRSFLCPFF